MMAEKIVDPLTQQPGEEVPPRRSQRKLLLFAVALICTMVGLVYANIDTWSLAFQGPSQGFAPRGGHGESPLGEIRPVSEGFHPATVIPNAFPAIKDVSHVSADQASDLVQGEELVLGVVVDGEARAYPINTLTGPQREIINDTLGGSAIAATW